MNIPFFYSYFDIDLKPSYNPGEFNVVCKNSNGTQVCPKNYEKLASVGVVCKF